MYCYSPELPVFSHDFFLLPKRQVGRAMANETSSGQSETDRHFHSATLLYFSFCWLFCRKTDNLQRGLECKAGMILLDFIMQPASVNNSTLLMLTPYMLCFSLVDTTLPALHCQRVLKLNITVLTENEFYYQQTNSFYWALIQQRSKCTSSYQRLKYRRRQHLIQEA